MLGLLLGSSAPVERKVQASTAAAAVSGVVLWLLGKYVFRGAVPDVFVSWVYAAVPGIITFVAGYKTRHTPRPDLEPAPAPSVPPAPVSPRGPDVPAG